MTRAIWHWKKNGWTRLRQAHFLMANLDTGRHNDYIIIIIIIVLLLLLLFIILSCNYRNE